MAILAGVRRTNMRRVLACRIDTIVTTEAAARDVGMVKDCRNPGSRLVAVVAPIARNDVIVRFPCRLKSVVTGIAAAGHGRMIHERQRAPRSCRVAIGTECRAFNVIRRPGRSLDRPDCRVTTGACRAGSLELAARMATVAGYVRVGIIEVESGREMVKRFLCRRRRHQHQNHEQYRNHGKYTGPGKARISVH